MRGIGALVVVVVAVCVVLVPAAPVSAAGIPGVWTYSAEHLDYDDTTNWQAAESAQASVLTSGTFWRYYTAPDGYALATMTNWTKRSLSGAGTRVDANGQRDMSVALHLQVPEPAAEVTCGAAFLVIDGQYTGTKFTDGTSPLGVSHASGGAQLGVGDFGAWPSLRSWGRVPWLTMPGKMKQIGIGPTTNLVIFGNGVSRFQDVTRDSEVSWKYYPYEGYLNLAPNWSGAATCYWRSLPGTSALEVGTIWEGDYGQYESWMTTGTVSGAALVSGANRGDLFARAPFELQGYEPGSDGTIGVAGAYKWFEYENEWVSWSGVSTDPRSVDFAARYIVGNKQGVLRGMPSWSSRDASLTIPPPSTPTTGFPGIIAAPGDWMAWFWGLGSSALGPFADLFWPMKLITDWEWSM
jgi:hypothetical protein